MITTYRYRIKDSGKSSRTLKKCSRDVNLVWNFCKQTQKDALKNKCFRLIVDKKTKEQISIPYFLTTFEMTNLVSGGSKELNLHSQTIQGIAEEYSNKRIKHKKLLRWRGKKSLGWIPFKASAIKVHNGTIKYNKHSFSFWNSRELPDDAKIKTGSFCQDKRGRWYLNIAFESQSLGIKRIDDKEIGIDIGIKTLATCSDGVKIDKPNLRNSALLKIKYLKRCQRFAQKKQSRSKCFSVLPKSKQEKNIHAKISNKRQDYLHKETIKLTKQSSLIIVGDVPCKLMNRSKNLSGISYDSGIGTFKNMLKYKAVRAASTYKEFSERNSTRTCSKCCFVRPRIELGVREWICENCASVHNRDVNAAINILQSYRISLRMGHHTPIRTKDISLCI